jgi:hypothetical protein
MGGQQSRTEGGEATRGRGGDAHQAQSRSAVGAAQVVCQTTVCLAWLARKRVTARPSRRRLQAA